jgi:P-type Ca2+ transporter type 2C
MPQQQRIFQTSPAQIRAAAPDRTATVVAVHMAVPGRARFHVRGLYRNDALCRRLETDLRGAPAVVRAEASRWTGNVLVRFDPKVTHQRILRLLERVIKAAAERAHASPLRAHPRGTAHDRGGSRSRALVRVDQPRLSRVQHAWHALPARVALAAHAVSHRVGLAANEAKRRLRRIGPNQLAPPVPLSPWRLFVRQWLSLPVALLGAASVISIATGALGDALVILGVVTINAVVGTVTEIQSERIISSLVPRAQRADVVRDGKSFSIVADDVVPGDLLVLRPGTIVAADARVVSAHGLSVDDSTLTGESHPAAKSAESQLAADAPVADRSTMVYRGTTVTGGQATAVVVATGMQTEAGRIQALVGEARAPESVWQAQLADLGRSLALAGGAACGAVCVIGMLRGFGFARMFQTSVSLAVAAIPEGLPAVATTTLALGIRRLRRDGVYIRRLDAIPALGALNVLCLDKTGTITENRLAAVEAYVDGQRVEIDDLRAPANSRPARAVERLLECCALCNEAQLASSDVSVEEGSGTELALLRAAESSGIQTRPLRRQWPVIRMMHRAERRNYMVTVHQRQDGSRRIIVKGSPEEVLALCSRRGDGTSRLDDISRRRIVRANHEMARKGLRVLGVAADFDSRDWHGVPRELTWIGLIAMADRTRVGIPAVMRALDRAGIKATMITGDQPETAEAVARRCRLVSSGHIRVATAHQLTRLDDRALRATTRHTNVFARVSPAQKLQIVRALQASGCVVGMTGDGVNDGPALAAADVGIAVSTSSGEVAQVVADVLLTGEHPEDLIVRALAEGRGIRQNVRKSLRFLLSTNLSELIVMLTGILAGIPAMLSPRQLLWINLLSDVAPSLALAADPTDPSVLRQAPRNPSSALFDRQSRVRLITDAGALSAAALTAYYYGLRRSGASHANSMAFLTLTCGQLLHALSCRSEFAGRPSEQNLPSNRALSASVAASIGAQVLAAAVPSLRRFMHLTPLGLIDAAVVAVTAVGPLLIGQRRQAAKR